MRTRTTILTITALTLCSIGLSACENTWHGMGRDMERNGQEMQDQYN